MRKSNLGEDFANLLLIVLKFFLVIILGLNQILIQLGLSLDDQRGVVNATPDVQSSDGGTFPLSFYALAYDLGGVQYRKTLSVWGCRRDQGCTFDWSLDADPAAPWKILVDQSQSACPAEERGDQEHPSSSASSLARICTEVIDLNRADWGAASSSDGGGLVPGVYRVIYRVTFTAARDESRVFPYWVERQFEVNYLPEIEGEWKLPLVQVVRGRTAPIPRGQQGAADSASGLAVFSGYDLSVGRKGDAPILIQLVGDRQTGRRFRIDYAALGKEESFEQEVEVQTQVDSVDRQQRYFRTADRSDPIYVDNDTRFLSPGDPNINSYSRGELAELQAGLKVHYELKPADNGQSRRVAEVVRYGSRLPVTVPFVVLANLPPRGIYKGKTGRGEREVLLNFPYDVNYNVLQGQGARPIWFFDLNQVIIDPDGVDAQGEPSVNVRSIRRGPGWPAGYELINDPNERSTQGSLLRIADLSQVRKRQEIQVQVADDLQTRTIKLVIDYDREPEELDRFKGILRAIQRQ